jgi:uncharacterized protein (TIGR02996 family)
MTTRNPGFEAALALRPDDQGVRLVYADFAADHGDEDYERALRWLAANDLWAVYLGDDRVWCFGTVRNTYANNRPLYPRLRPALLPADLFARLTAVVDQRAHTDWWCYFSTHQAATEYLARALAPAAAPEASRA